jgi:hypothetical protein
MRKQRIPEEIIGFSKPFIPMPMRPLSLMAGLHVLLISPDLLGRAVQYPRCFLYWLWKRSARCSIGQLTRGKKDGGIGLLPIGPQVSSLCCKFFVWVLSEGEHPLQQIMRI